MTTIPTQAKLCHPREPWVPAGTDDLMDVDVNALDGEQLAIYVFLARGYKWYIGGIAGHRILFLQHPDRLVFPQHPLWDGGPFLSIAHDTHNWLERPDRDTDAAVQLLEELLKGDWKVTGMGIAPADDVQNEMRYLSLKRYSNDFRLTADSTGDSMAELFTRAFLLAWQAERKAEREQEAAAGEGRGKEVFDAES